MKNNCDALYLPRLYKRNSKGKIQIWETHVLSNPDHSKGYDIWTQHGIEGGKIQSTVDSIFEGKNIGKKNETTPKDQAFSEAKSKWTKQIERKGYVENIEDVDRDLRPGAEAMLAQRYDKYPDKITFPAFIQPKLDGHRCIAVVSNGKCSLFSRQRTPITGLPHIERAVETMSHELGRSDTFILDGELYNHDYRENFEDLTGFIRSEEPKEGHEVVQYHIYDIVALGSYDNRLKVLNLIKYNDTLKQVETSHVANDEEVLKLFRVHRDLGYEGSILRNTDGLYEGKRSYDLQKVKEFVDEEFKITDVEEGRGKMKGHAIFVCETSDGKAFKAKMKGPMEKLAEYYQNKDQYVGRIITVMFQEYTKDGIPRFPVALRFREDV